MTLPPTPRLEAPAPAVAAVPIALDAAAVALHPLLDSLPPLDPTTPEVLEFVRQVEDAGAIHVPVLVDERHRLLDGRRRLLAARELRLPLPAIVAPADTVTLVQALLASGRYSKGAVAFLSFPHMEGYLEHSRQRRLDNLKRGNGLSPQNGLSGRKGATAEQLAETIGISRAYFFEAEKLHRLLPKLTDEQRTTIVRDLLSGDLGLGYAVTAANNYLRNEEQPSRLDKRQEHDRLFIEHWTRLNTQWSEANPDQRANIERDLRAASAQWDGELKDLLRRVAK